MLSVNIDDYSQSSYDEAFGARDDARVTSQIGQTEEFSMQRRWSTICKDRLPSLNVERLQEKQKLPEHFHVRRATISGPVDGPVRKMSDKLKVRSACLPIKQVQFFPDTYQQKKNRVPITSIPELSDSLPKDIVE
ncbi:hypothetical protein ACF0H5_023566 [Mactra antiquata]